VAQRHLGYPRRPIDLCPLALVVLVACGGIGTRAAGSSPVEAGAETPAPDGAVAAVSVCAQKWLLYAGGGPAQCQGTAAGVRLCGPPLASSPTADGFGLSVVLASGDPAQLTARVRAAGAPSWGDALASAMRAPDTAEWRIRGLLPGRRYEYEIRSTESEAASPLYTGSVVTTRPPGDAFTFALISDTHVGTDPDDLNQGDWCALSAIAAKVDALAPDFIVNLGDMLDFHKYGFNEAPPYSALLATAYRNYRALLGDTLGHAAHFAVVGN
jgi:hypothetical protein